MHPTNLIALKIKQYYNNKIIDYFGTDSEPKIEHEWYRNLAQPYWIVVFDFILLNSSCRSRSD